MKKVFAKKMKYIIVAIILMGSVVLCSSYIRTFLFVRMHIAELQDIADGFISEKDNLIKQYRGCSIAYVDGESTGMIQFCLGRFGIASSTNEYGFYYSPDDLPHVYWDYPSELSEQTKNLWEYQLDGNNYGKTRKICPYWYYYSVSF